MLEERQPVTDLRPLDGRFRGGRLETGARVDTYHGNRTKEERGREFQSFLWGTPGDEGGEKRNSMYPIVAIVVTFLSPHHSLSLWIFHV